MDNFTNQNTVHTEDGTGVGIGGATSITPDEENKN